MIVVVVVVVDLDGDGDVEVDVDVDAARPSTIWTATFTSPSPSRFTSTPTTTTTTTGTMTTEPSRAVDLQRVLEWTAVIGDETHYAWLAACYARGVLGVELRDADVIAAAERAGLRMHRFKRSAELPRVRAMLGTLRGLGVETLLDVGSGRGVFLWPMLDGLPDVRVTSIDVLAERAQQIAAVAKGGVERLSVARMDAGRLGFGEATFDVVTVLEVLEHVAEPERVAREVVRVARRAVLATVPSHEDDNPEHVRLFTAERLRALFEEAGARRVVVDGVRGHLTAVAMCDE